MSVRRTLPGTKKLTTEGDLAAAMVTGIDQYLTRETENTPKSRSSAQDPLSQDGLRKRLSEILGLMDRREKGSLRIQSGAEALKEVGEGPGFRIYEVCWSVLRGVDGEGLLMVPEGDAVANIIAMPDCEISPEEFAGLSPGRTSMSRIPRLLAQSGCRVLIPVLMDRKCTHSGNPDIAMTNQPHREFVYRAAYELGRHVIGYEIQKVLAAVDTFESGELPIGVFGHGEGGLIAFYSAALDDRIDSTVVSGFFQPREGLWSQPIYRNVFGLLNDFGDAEVAAMISPRKLVVEIADHAEVVEPPECKDVRQSGAPGRLSTPDPVDVSAEFDRAVERSTDSSGLVLTTSSDGRPGAEETLNAFLDGLGASFDRDQADDLPASLRDGVCPDMRFKRQFDQLVEHTQVSLREAEDRRAEYWAEARGANSTVYPKQAELYRERLWKDVIGSLPPIEMAPNPHSRLFYDDPKVKAYEVALDVYPDVFAYGILLVPKRIRKGEKRPVVVCQHGLEGRPQDVVGPEGPRHPYGSFAYELAKEGFVTYAPQNPYIGQDAFRVLQRKANPLKLSLFSFIVRQHEQTLGWLSTLPFVDSDRIAFYGLSYGGKTAMRVPALVKQYCLSICSADYNEWIMKNVTVHHRCSYMFSGEYEMPEFNLGNTFNYAEMSWLICPRPFMVERGHHDGCAPDEWVGYEYAKTYRHYALQGLGDRTEIEYFDGPHTINGEGTFAFLRKHLGK
jgi:cephalosporin-C deacetylase-like acetyl esterase